MRWRVMVREFDRRIASSTCSSGGPFARWEHRHRFVEGRLRGRPGIAGTWVKDRLTYRLPLGGSASSPCARRRRRISGLFDYRDRRLRELLS